jgi:hypothetical protein
LEIVPSFGEWREAVFHHGCFPVIRFSNRLQACGPSFEVLVRNVLWHVHATPVYGDHIDALFNRCRDVFQVWNAFYSENGLPTDVNGSMKPTISDMSPVIPWVKSPTVCVTASAPPSMPMYLMSVVSVKLASYMTIKTLRWSKPPEDDPAAKATDDRINQIGKILSDIGQVDSPVQVTNMAGVGGGLAFSHVVNERQTDADLIIAASQATTGVGKCDTFGSHSRCSAYAQRDADRQPFILRYFISSPQTVKGKHLISLVLISDFESGSS